MPAATFFTRRFVPVAVAVLLSLIGLSLIALTNVQAQPAPAADRSRLGAPAASTEGTETLPPGAFTQTMLTNMTNPIAMAFDPQGRLFYTEKTTGQVRLFQNSTLQANPVITFSVSCASERGLLGIAVDPQFNINHYIYVYYTVAVGATDCNTTPATVNRVARFTENNGVGSNPQTIFESPQTAGNHNGGNIHFGPDGKLYITIGENANPANSQDVTVKNGKIHRINSDGTIPADNPVFTQTGALPSLYAMGLRNSFDFAFDPLTPGRIFASENGPNCDDEMNRIVGGYNYGWRQNYACDDATTPDPTYNTIAPLWSLPRFGPSCCQAPVGITVYSGGSVPQWTNGIFMATYNNQELRHFYLNPARTDITAVNVVQNIFGGTDIETGPDGALWYIQAGGYSPGTLIRILGSGGTATATPPPATATRTPTVTSTNTVPPSATPTSTIPPNTATTTPGPGTPSVTPTNTIPPNTATTTPGPGTPSITPTNTALPNTATPTPGPGTPSITATPTMDMTMPPTDTPGPSATPPSPLPSPTACTISFSDVLSSNVFYPFVQCLACHGILSGYADGTFQPSANVSRGQLAKIVALAAQLNGTPTSQTFTDVLAGNVFYPFVEQMASRTYVSGYTCGGSNPQTGVAEPCDAQQRPYFRPSNTASRGQIAKVVGEAYGLTGNGGAQRFADIAPGSTFYAWINGLAALGSISGYDCGGPNEPCNATRQPYFRPSATTSRGQTAKIVGNTFFPNCAALSTGSVDVRIESFAFQPPNLSLPAGTTVRWTDYDLDYHTVTAIDGSFDSGNIQRGQSYQRTFNVPGIYTYYCQPHHYMTGTLTITMP
ncbi:MAG: PQQ-dependent sugar dehydrogenase [Chloroflexota bacterium]|nr:PQQ-dependent sugar dehydrogenase [Chloroflexota bacterium]